MGSMLVSVHCVSVQLLATISILHFLVNAYVRVRSAPFL